ncbi:MAG: hypothetical protein OEM97_08590 [Acidimicrobiia bacterium]|nr:hypothetical protein [Acidimicrobiia bacterium]
MSFAWFTAVGTGMNNPVRILVRIALMMAARTAVQAFPFSGPFMTSRAELIAGSEDLRTASPAVRTAVAAGPGD